MDCKVDSWLRLSDSFDIKWDSLKTIWLIVVLELRHVNVSEMLLVDIVAVRIPYWVRHIHAPCFAARSTFFVVASKKFLCSWLKVLAKCSFGEQLKIDSWGSYDNGKFCACFKGELEELTLCTLIRGNLPTYLMSSFPISKESNVGFWRRWGISIES